MVESYKPLLLNLGCGLHKLQGFVNVDLYGDVDVRHDLTKTPYPWDDNTVDGIEMWHTLEHIPNWWDAFTECARILKPGGFLNIRVPHWSSVTALTYRDHYHVFSQMSFHGIQGRTHGTSTWAATENDSVPLKMVDYRAVPYKQYQWMIRWCPWFLAFAADHLNGFIWEQRFYFQKIGDRA